MPERREAFVREAFGIAVLRVNDEEEELVVRGAEWRAADGESRSLGSILQGVEGIGGGVELWKCRSGSRAGR